MNKSPKMYKGKQQKAKNKSRNVEFFALDNFIVEEIYERTIIRAFEMGELPTLQLFHDFIDILIWLEFSKEVKPLKKRFAYIKCVELELKKHQR